MESFSEQGRWWSHRKETDLYGWIAKLTLKNNNGDGKKKVTGNIVKEIMSVKWKEKNVMNMEDI